MKRRFVTFFCVLCLVALSFAIVVCAADAPHEGNCGQSLRWTLDENGILTISGSGEMDDYIMKSAPWYSERERITSLIIEEGVTSIGSFAFYNCQQLCAASIPASITSIGHRAFLYCGNLSDIYLTDLSSWCSATMDDSSPGSNLYLNGVLQEEIDIPKDIDCINSHVFCNKNGITKITIPENIRHIAACAFGIGNINRLVFLGNAPEFASEAFSGLTATVYYPEKDSTWSEEVRQNYGGSIIWKTYECTDYPCIIVQPQSQTAMETERIDFSVVAVGTGLSYQWQFRHTDFEDWQSLVGIEGSKATLVLSASYETAGQYRCVITDQNGSSIISDTTVLTAVAQLFCDTYTPQIIANTLRYLDEIYIEQYPEMGLRFLYGGASERIILEDLAEVITEGCSTDREKVNAIESWIIRNITYDEYGKSYPIDVFISREANCFGYAQLMQELVRLCGIPAVWSDGWRGDMAVTKPADLRSLPEGHAWCYIYLDGQWILYDPLWLPGGTTQWDYVAQHYYGRYVEAVIPRYSSFDIPLWADESPANCYSDGKFIVCCGGNVHEGNVTLSINLDTRYSTTTFQENTHWEYAEQHDAMQGMTAGDAFRNGWIDYAGNWYHYAYENGIQAYATVRNWNGADYYMGAVSAMRLCIPSNSYRIESGTFIVNSDYSGRIMEPAWTDAFIQLHGGEIRWESSDPDIAEVDPDGVVTCKNAGDVTIGVDLVYEYDGTEISGVHTAFDICFTDEERVCDYSDNVDDHEHRYSEIQRDTYVIFTCSDRDCADSYIEYQTDHTHNYIPQVTPPTCFNPGRTIYVCVCGSAYIADETEALGHDITDWVETKPATCTEEGMEIRSCTRCKYAETRNSPPTGHSYTAVISYPTCTDVGFTTYTCTCGNTYISDKVAALGHDYSEGNCTRCGGEDLDYVLPNPFTDVQENAYYMDPVLWAVKNQITSGTSSTSFSPDVTCTRAQVVTFLWRAMGKPEPSSAENPFTDVPEDTYYYEAVLWAVENSITSGTGNGKFSPEDPCTRNQVVTFLWRTMGKPTHEKQDNPFADVREGTYYYEPVLWAVENGITSGTSTTTFAPDDPCTRAQVVTFLYRTMQDQ